MISIAIVSIILLNNLFCATHSLREDIKESNKNKNKISPFMKKALLQFTNDIIILDNISIVSSGLTLRSDSEIILESEYSKEIQSRYNNVLLSSSCNKVNLNIYIFHFYQMLIKNYH